MADCNTCSQYMSVEDILRRSIKCDANENVAMQGGLLNGLLKNVQASNPAYRTLLVDSNNVIWSTNGYSDAFSGKLFRSTDFVNYTQILTFGSPNKINGIFELSDGELLIITEIQAVSNLDNCGVFKTINNRTDKKQVITPRNTNVRYVADWGISVSGNNVVVSEYGAFTELDATRGSRYLYHSDDAGETFSVILDLMNAPVNLFPHADGWKLAHIHCCAYDSVWDRIWIGTGDGDNSKIFAWTDDLGVTWNSVNLFNYFGDNVNVQAISIGVADDAILFGTDNPDGGVIKIERTTKEATPMLEMAYPYNTASITHLTGIMKQYNKLEPLLIPNGRGGHIPESHDERHSFILAYFNGRIWKTWQDIEECGYPRNSVIINRLNDKLVIELDNTYYSVDKLSETPAIAYVPCRYIADFSMFKDIKPTGLQVTFNVNTISSVLSWTDNTGGTAKHEIYRSIDGVNYTLITTVNAGVSGYTDTTCPQGTTVYYKVRAYSGLLRSDYNISSLKIPFCLKSNQTTLVPSVLNILNITAGKTVTINWGDGTTQNVTGNNSTITKNYTVTGQYDISISGDTEYITVIQIASQLKFYGDISSWVTPLTLTSIALGGTSISGKIDNWTIPPSCGIVTLDYMANLTGGLPKIAANANAALSISLRNNKLSYANAPLIYRRYMSKLDIQAQGVAFNTEEIDKLFKSLADFYETTAPTANCTYNTSGANMGIPTGGATNVDIVRLKGYYTAAGFTATVTVRTV